MIPALATALIVALVMGFPLHQQAKRAKRAETDANLLSDLLTISRVEVKTLKATAARVESSEATAESLAVTLLETRVEASRARQQRDAAWAELRALRTERERHTTLLSLPGIRADREDGISYDAPAEVVALDSKRGRA
jgi:hypothetical protein